MEWEKRIEAAAEYIKRQTKGSPSIGLILGSGLGSFADTLTNAVSMKFADIPGFPVPTVSGHSGELVIGEHGGRLLVALKGRVHFYEGIPQNEVVIPVRVMKKLGVKTLLLTNAAGGINLHFKEGVLMLITDHINFSGSNPLLGKNLDEVGPRFPDMSDVYSRALRAKLKELAQKEEIPLEEGVYAMYSGPNYETPAEIRMFRTLGADAVGMSTVPEAIAACHAGMAVLGVSCITNMAAGVLDRKLDHQEVVETAARVKNDFIKVLELAISICP